MNNLKMLKYLLDYCEYNRRHRSYIFITQTDKILLSKYKWQSQVSRKIKQLVCIGVLVEMKELGYVVKKYSKHYYFNKENFETVMSLYKSLGIEEQEESFEYVKEKLDKDIWNIDFDKMQELKDKEVDDILLKNKVMFSSCIKIERTDTIEYQIKRGINYIYGFYQKYRDIIKIINENTKERLKEQFGKELQDEFYSFEEINMMVHLKGDNHISGIGTRAYSEFCSIKSKEKAMSNGEKIDENKMYREDYLTNRFGGLYTEYDVHGSVPRLARALSKIDDKVIGLDSMDNDPYKEMFYSFIEDYRIYINSESKGWSEARQFFKGLFMRLYFGGSVNMIVDRLCRAERDEYIKFINGKVDSRELG